MNNLFSPRFIFVITAVLIAAASRLIPHPPNFTPIAAMALFCAGNCTNKYSAFIIPLVAMLLSDLLIGFHNTLIPVYVSFIFTVMIGFVVLRNKVKLSSLFTASIMSSVLFFIITNFGVWFQGSLYPKNIAGITECFMLAIPFFKNTLLGDMFFSAILFGTFYLAQIKFPKLVKV